MPAGSRRPIRQKTADGTVGHRFHKARRALGFRSLKRTPRRRHPGGTSLPPGRRERGERRVTQDPSFPCPYAKRYRRSSEVYRSARGGR